MILISTPLKREFLAVNNAFLKKEIKTKISTIGKIETVEIPSLNAHLMVGGHGKVQYAVQTQYAINYIKDCELVICAGAAGSLNKELNVGDVVVGEATIEHDYNIKFGSEPPSLPSFNGDIETINKIKSLTKTYSFSIQYGKIASGDEDIVSNKRANEIAVKTNALCVAWEGAGGAKATQFNNIPFIEIRGITDSADKLAASDFYKNVNIALGNITGILIDLLENV